MVRSKSAPTTSAGRNKELTESQRLVVKELKSKGQSIEELAVGFGVSYNTIRNILREPLQDEEPSAPDAGEGQDAPPTEAE